MKQVLAVMDTVAPSVEASAPRYYAAREALRAAIEQAQEPFCYHDGRNIVGKEFADHSDVFPLYTAPRQWQGLTEAEKVNVALECGCADVAWMDFADAIESKLREKNT